MTKGFGTPSKAGQQGCGVILFFAAAACVAIALFAIARAETRRANSVATTATILFDAGGSYIYQFSANDKQFRGTLVTRDKTTHFNKGDSIPIRYNALDPNHNNYGTTLEPRSPGESPTAWFVVAGFLALCSLVKFAGARSAPLDFPS